MEGGGIKRLMQVVTMVGAGVSVAVVIAVVVVLMVVVLVVVVVVVVETGILRRRENRERERGGRWQVWGWAFLMVVTAVAGRQMASVLLGESHKQGHRESQEDQSRSIK